MDVTSFLLLSCVGLVMTAQVQDCSRPVGGPNMNLKDSDLLLETFPNGTKVSFACDVGFASAGGSPVITCTNGTWSPVKLKCERKNCGPAGEMENGHIDYSEGTDFGDKIVITCNSGYRFVGKQEPREILCGDKGWMSRLPVCEAVTCNPLPPIVGGTFSPDKETYSYGDVVKYSCQNDLTLSGSSSISCSDDGIFQPAPPTCIMVQCKDPEVENADWVGGSRPPFGYKAIATFKCRSGHIMKGEATQTCEMNSQWSPGLPTCEMVTCEPPPTVADGTFSPNKDKYVYGEVVQYSCEKEFTLSGLKSVSCSEDGTFKPAPPTCVMVTCEPPPTVADGTFSPNKDKYVYGEVVQYSCEKEFTLSGLKSVSCSEDGTFKPAPPTCVKMPDPTKATTTTKKPTDGYCENPVIKNAEQIEGSGPPYRYNDKVTYQCKSRFSMIGEPTQTCEQSGQWSPGLPKCKSDAPPKYVMPLSIALVVSSPILLVQHYWL
ncbi:C4b-binding protein alpha chain-like isoform X2 [Chaetodon trifascialis]|uniref:C4b-binding protein alpha chain-like isoform X2 n=1 Tax=Chaetodon trifascialis TaxID=109706 RepID=UPI0039952258